MSMFQILARRIAEIQLVHNGAMPSKRAIETGVRDRH